MGYLRLNIYYSLLSMGVGKTVRYYIVMAFMMGLMDSMSDFF
jgi:membrane protein YqaA with SNARE-associated domain